MPAKTQQDLLTEELMSQPKTTKEKIRLPGIEVLHQKSKEEISEVLTMVLKSRANIIGLNWVIGSHIEVTLD